MIDNFDILIGATAITNEMIMVTNNVDHLNRLNNIVIEDWTKLAKNSIAGKRSISLYGFLEQIMSFG